MKVFISHGGNRSRALALKIDWFVRRLIQSTNPWVSTGIDKGSKWEREIAQNLEQAGIGIVCLTSDNLNNRWMLFEAGALSKRFDDKVCTLLLDVTASQVEPPLSQFQHTKSERDDVLKLVVTINKMVAEAKETPCNDKDLNDQFDLIWPELEKTIASLRTQAPASAPVERRSERAMVAEMLDLVREISRREESAAWRHEKTLHILHQVYQATVGKKAPTLAEFRSLARVAKFAEMVDAALSPGTDPAVSAKMEPLRPHEPIVDLPFPEHEPEKPRRDW
jgi:hypothetical protein